MQPSLLNTYVLPVLIYYGNTATVLGTTAAKKASKVYCYLSVPSAVNARAPDLIRVKQGTHIQQISNHSEVPLAQLSLIVNAILEILPQLRRWNHIFRDVTRWLRSHCAPSQDISITVTSGPCSIFLEKKSTTSTLADAQPVWGTWSQRCKHTKKVLIDCK